MPKLIEPHGGKLINRFADNKAELLSKSKGLKSLELDERSLADLECIATGVYSPLEGFVSEADYKQIVENMRLSNGLAWSIPITLQIAAEQASEYNVGQEIALTNNAETLAIMTITDKYQPDQNHEAEQVYKTTDAKHPGVAAMLAAGTVYLGGPITIIADFPEKQFPIYNLSPEQTRAEFDKRNWQTVVAFQTRNPIHRAHEYLTKVALESVDGLYINPLIGATKKGDIPADVRMQCYQVLMDNYYPDDRVALGTYPAAMRYAGPREAILHAISRQNYGCSHFIVGRDHAGVGDYYGTYDAQEIFDNYNDDELAINLHKFEHCFYCNKCDSVASFKTCPHTAEDRVFLSGTKVRQMLENGEMLPTEFSRPEVAKILIQAYKDGI